MRDILSVYRKLMVPIVDKNEIIPGALIFGKSAFHRSKFLIFGLGLEGMEIRDRVRDRKFHFKIASRSLDEVITLSSKPNCIASSADIQLSRSIALSISSADFPVESE